MKRNVDFGLPAKLTSNHTPLFIPTYAMSKSRLSSETLQVDFNSDSPTWLQEYHPLSGPEKIFTPRTPTTSRMPAITEKEHSLNGSFITNSDPPTLKEEESLVQSESWMKIPNRSTLWSRFNPTTTEMDDDGPSKPSKQRRTFFDDQDPSSRRAKTLVPQFSERCTPLIATKP